MSIGSALAIAKKKTEIGVGLLFSSVIIQTFGYGLLFNFSVLMRNLSIIGGLLMLLADSLNASKRTTIYAGLPNINQKDKSIFLLNGEFTVTRVLVIVVSFFSCVMVVIGFKAKYSAWLLIAVLSVGNFLLNNWWSLHHQDHLRDFIKYDFFQTLSIMGGFLLLANIGAGEFSMDEKKKNF
ncbi:hypothetical protein HDU92_004111 [Lobulomyces angularis]|nr:hypothetical protein HDU92_004111 [Lobulomyces angularis]